MGDNLKDFLALTEQYAKDIEAVYDSYQNDREEIGEGIKDDEDVKAAVQTAVNEVKASADQHFDEMMNLTRTYLENIKQLPGGDQPNQDLPATDPIVPRPPVVNPLEKKK